MGVLWNRQWSKETIEIQEVLCWGKIKFYALFTYLSKEKREWDKISPVQAFADIQIMNTEINQNFRLY